MCAILLPAVGSPAVRIPAWLQRAGGRVRPRATGVALCLALCVASAFAGAPRMQAEPHPDQWLPAGRPADGYFVIDNRWGRGSLEPGDYWQGIGTAPDAAGDGAIAFRLKWQWPQGDTEVKGYPAALFGRKPGHAGYGRAGRAGGTPEGEGEDDDEVARETGGDNGSDAEGQAQGARAGRAVRLPLQLPLPPLAALGAWQHNEVPSGQGQIAFDLWLQSDPVQGHGWQGASITHEIMVTLDHWGGYGAHDRPGGRNPGWYDHDVELGGRRYHVYITKGQDGCARYDFGTLDGSHGRSGWKLISFIPEQLPVAPGDVDLGAIVNHVASRSDSCGEPWATGDEHLVSVELGVEPVVGSGDLSVWNYRVASLGAPAVRAGLGSGGTGSVTERADAAPPPAGSGEARERSEGAREWSGRKKQERPVRWWRRLQPGRAAAPG